MQTFTFDRESLAISSSPDQPNLPNKPHHPEDRVPDTAPTQGREDRDDATPPSQEVHASQNVYSFANQFRAVLAIELLLLTMIALVAYGFWRTLCDTSLESCLATGPIAKPTTFILLSIIRPFVFTPLFFVAVVAGKSFGPVTGALLTTIGGLLSTLVVFFAVRILGKKLAKPWLRSNLPATFRFIHSQDYKIIFAARLIPLLPFDVVSFFCGVLDFRVRSVILGTLFGSLPEAFLFAKLVDPSDTVLQSTLKSLVVFSATVITPLLVFEFFSRKKGTGMWQLTKAMWSEIRYEVQTNNEIVRRNQFDPSKPAVLLLYGFFSSRRAVTVLERMLTSRGHQVMSFNLGGLLGVFFTRDILETATFIDYKVKRQMERHGFPKINIVAHSKGGLVALWWVLKLGGSKYCDKVITMGTPFQGSPLTYLALLTPLGLFWRDVGQMRPGSLFLKSLHDSEIPPSLKIYCLYSMKDRVASGAIGIFAPRHPTSNISAWPMHHVNHFEFLYKRDVGETISSLLSDRLDLVKGPARKGAPKKLSDARSSLDNPTEATLADQFEADLPEDGDGDEEAG